MNITLDQARAFAAVADHQTIQAAAKNLNKGHSGVLYLIKTLEEQLGITLFNRTKYRNTLTQQGKMVLVYCRQLLQTETELGQLCQKFQQNWEPSLKLIYDGVVDFNLIANALYKLNAANVPTDVRVLSAYLHEVKSKFHQEKADLMVTIIPFEQSGYTSLELKPIKMHLVAHPNHPLGKIRGKIKIDRIQKHTFIKIRNADIPLGLSTEQIELPSSFLVNDFATKRLALIKELGYGWLPLYLIEKDLKANRLKILNTQIKNHHLIQPRIYHPNKDLLGNTARQLLDLLT